MNLVDLAAELVAGHPDTGPYDADATVAATQGNLANRTRNKTSLSGNELFTSTDGGEFAALSDAKRQMWVSWCNTDRDPTDASNITFVNYIFGVSSTTLANLAAIRIELISRFVEQGLGKPTAGDIQRARAL